MKTHKTTRHSSSPKSPTAFNLTLPTAWEELSDAQYIFVLRLLQLGVSSDALLMRAFFSLAGFSLVRMLPKVAVVRKGLQLLRFRREDVAAACDRLRFLLDGTTVPRLPKSRALQAPISPLLHNVPFGTYLQLENLFQAYFADPSDTAPLQRVFSLVYPKQPQREFALFCVAAVIWWTALKKHFTQIFPDLFVQSAAADAVPQMAEIMMSEIRALTGGDITKNHEVLNADTYAALHELNAKCADNRNLKQ